MQRRDVLKGLLIAAVPAAGLAVGSQDPAVGSTGVPANWSGGGALRIREQGGFAVGGSVTRTAGTFEQWFYNQFRLGLWPDLYPGVQFSNDPESLNQFFRQMVPDTGPISGQLRVDGTSALFDRIGEGILVTHSHAGGFGWRATMKNRRIKAVIALEPGSGFVFPEGELPEAVSNQRRNTSHLKVAASLIHPSGPGFRHEFPLARVLNLGAANVELHRDPMSEQ